MYSEFLDGTGCRQTDYNYQVYKRIEAAYMSDDTMTKADAYDWGRKLVDNSLTEEELGIIDDLEARNETLSQFISDELCTIEYHKRELANSKEYLRQLKAERKQNIDRIRGLRTLGK